MCSLRPHSSTSDGAASSTSGAVGPAGWRPPAGRRPRRRRAPGGRLADGVDLAGVGAGGVLHDGLDEVAVVGVAVRPGRVHGLHAVVAHLEDRTPAADLVGGSGGRWAGVGPRGTRGLRRARRPTGGRGGRPGGREPPGRRGAGPAGTRQRGEASARAAWARATSTGSTMASRAVTPAPVDHDRDRVAVEELGEQVAPPAAPGRRAARPGRGPTEMVGTGGPASRPTPRPVDVGHHGEGVVEGMDGAPLDVLPVDGDLGDGESQAPGPGQDLHVEGEPVDAHQVEEEPGDRRPERLEPALGVLQPEPGPGRHQPVEEAAHEGAHHVGGLDHRVGQRTAPDGDVVAGQSPSSSSGTAIGSMAMSASM